MWNQSIPIPKSAQPGPPHLEDLEFYPKTKPASVANHISKRMSGAPKQRRKKEGGEKWEINLEKEIHAPCFGGWTLSIRRECVTEAGPRLRSLSLVSRLLLRCLDSLYRRECVTEARARF